jgi:acyl-coenzyme A synthetase/AMP-(fatty) acid ligase
MVEHANVARLFSETQPWFQFSARDVWTLFHSFAFDFSVWELWGSLFYGGSALVVPYATARSALDFHKLICEQGVTVLNQTPSAFAQFITALRQVDDSQRSLRLVIFGGEALEPRMLKPWITANPVDTTSLINMYGITETTVHVTYRRLTGDEICLAKNSPIGRPIPDLRTYLLDGEGQPVPAGVLGEICVGGGGVTRGYLGRPDLTAEKFVADPFATEPGARMYKSGDLGRWLTDGAIEYIGRADFQVKIRGFRIELGEIEAQLAHHLIVKEATVVAREDISGERRLVAYIVPRNLTEAEWVGGVSELRAYLKSELPEHMIPSAFVKMESLPLTVSGKLDRRALPVPDWDAEGRGHYEPPQGETEEILANLWRSVLHREEVGRGSNFFLLGGHSLLATALLVKIRQAFSMDVPMTVVFESPELRSLAARIDELRQENFERMLSEGGDDLEKILEKVVSMPDAQAREMIETLRSGKRH